MAEQQTYWHMQLHPTGKEKEYDAGEIVETTNLIGLGDWKEGDSQRKQFKDEMKIGDIVLIRKGTTPKALVEVIGEWIDFGKEPKEIAWFQFRRKVKILEISKTKIGFPQPRGTLQKSINKNTPTYKYIDNWYNEIIERKVDINDYKHGFSLSLNELKSELGEEKFIDEKTISYLDIKKFYDNEIDNIQSISIEIKNVKSITHCEKFIIELNNELYTIVGNNGIGKSGLLISIGQLIQQNYLTHEFKGDAFENSHITYIINNKIKFEWAKHRKSDDTNHWSLQNPMEFRDKMPRIDGFFESGIISGSRFEHLKFKKAVLDKVDKKNEIKEDSKQDKKAIDFIKDNLDFIINGKDKTNKYDSLFTDEVSIEKKDGKKIKIETEIIYFYKSINDKIISEYSFSTGEYFVLALLKFIATKIDKNIKSVIIIDEIDISLHPLAQQRLIEKIDEFRKEYSITFIIATHSLQIIEQVNAKNIYYFENDNGNINVSNPIYPAYLTRKLYKHINYDRVILVEDDLAKLFIEKFIEKYEILKNKSLIYTIISIGGWNKVIETVIENKNEKYYSSAKVLVVLDDDIRHNIDVLDYKDKLPKDIKIKRLKKYIVKKIFDDTKFFTNIEKRLQNHKKYAKNKKYVNNKQDINDFYQNFIDDFNKSEQIKIEELIQEYIFNDLKYKEQYNIRNKQELLYVPIDENIERYIMTSLLENKDFYKYIDDNLLSTQNAKNLELKKCIDCDTDTVKENLEEILIKLKENSSYSQEDIKNKVIQFIVEQNLDGYSSFEKDLITFFEE